MAIYHDGIEVTAAGWWAAEIAKRFFLTNPSYAPEFSVMGATVIITQKDGKKFMVHVEEVPSEQIEKSGGL